MVLFMHQHTYDLSQEYVICPLNRMLNNNVNYTVTISCFLVTRFVKGFMPVLGIQTYGDWHV